LENKTPWIYIEPIGNLSTCEGITIQGSTNLDIKDKLLIRLTSTKYVIGDRWPSDGSETNVTIIKGTCGNNTWSVTLTPGTIHPDEYIVIVRTMDWAVVKTKIFNIFDTTCPNVKST
jgi:hypothetical protein